MGFKKRERWRRNNQKSVKPNDTVPRGGGGRGTRRMVMKLEKGLHLENHRCRGLLEKFNRGR